MARVCGPCMALLAFAVTIFRGLSADNSTDTILIRALWSMFAFLIVGTTIGWIGQAVVAEHHQRIQEQEARERAEAEADEAQAESPEAEDEKPAGTSEGRASRAPEGAGARAG